jgi:hypothetical protein
MELEQYQLTQQVIHNINLLRSKIGTPEYIRTVSMLCQQETEELLIKGGFKNGDS